VRRRIVLLLCALVMTSSGLFAYIRQTTRDVIPVPLSRPDHAAVQFYLNDQVLPGAQGAGKTVISSDSNPQEAVRAALAAWNSVTGSSARFLPMRSTSVGIDPNDRQMTIAIASTPADLSAVGSAVALTLVAWVTDGSIIDSDIILNPAYGFSTTGAPNTTDLQAVLTHELGHALSANHSGLLGAAMYPYCTKTVERTLSTDDVAFIRSAYPAGVATPAGTVRGTITTTAGTPAPFAMLTLIDTAAGTTLGGLAGADGSYSIAAPPGSYLVYAEPFNSFVGPGNFYLTASQAASALKFQSTFFGGNANPEVVLVAENGTAEAPITVPAGSSALQIQSYGIGAAGKSGDVTTLISVVSPIVIASGQSLDFAFLGPGLDSSLTESDFRIYGQGISIRPGTLRVDRTVSFGGNPLLRVTLDITAQQANTLASIFISKGPDSLSLSGVLVITPPAPAFISRSVVSAASGAGNGSDDGAVSPGEYVTIYGTNLGPAHGPVSGGYLNGGYDGNGFLASDLAGVNVTFDGVAAPLFFVSGGQINLQVPFEVADKTSARVVVNFLGAASATIRVPVLPAHPAIFPIGTAAYATNQNYSLNSVTNPAGRGEYITIYGTGIGKPSYPIQTGTGAPVPPSPALNANGFTCTIGGVSATVAFAGWTPTAVALAQWNIQIPPSLSATGALPVVLTSAEGSTQSGLTVFVK
jgi:uncharacterized protein (TIGR03437 family)